MRKVTLYRIEKDEIGQPECVPYVEMPEFRRYPNTIVGMGSSAMMSDTIGIVRMPIETISYHDGRPDEYIAIEPELKDLLTMDWRQRASRVEKENADLKVRLNRTKGLYDELHTWADSLRSKPWYKRVWQAIRLNNKKDQ